MDKAMTTSTNAKALADAIDPRMWEVSPPVLSLVKVPREALIAAADFIRTVPAIIQTRDEVMQSCEALNKQLDEIRRHLKILGSQSL